MEIYSKPEHAGAFDAVATCFFIDTAPVAMEYIDVIKHVLRPGGVWVNCGPLSFHWQSPDPAEEADASSVDARYGRSVELCYSEVRHAIIASGFKIVVSGPLCRAVRARRACVVIFVERELTAFPQNRLPRRAAAEGGHVQVDVRVRPAVALQAAVHGRHL